VTTGLYLPEVRRSKLGLVKRILFEYVLVKESATGVKEKGEEKRESFHLLFK